MRPDSLDDLLDHSAPRVNARLDAPNIRTMMRYAKKTAKRSAKGYRVRVGVIAGLSTILLAGGGVAVAQSIGWSPETWAPRYEQPDVSFPVTLPSSRTCDVRAIAVSATDDLQPRRDVNEKFRDWLKSTDLQSVLNLSAARVEDARMAAESPGQTVVLGPEGLLMDVPKPPDARSADDVYANVIQIAVKNALLKEAATLHMNFDASTFNAVIKCDPVAQ